MLKVALFAGFIQNLWATIIPSKWSKKKKKRKKHLLPTIKHSRFRSLS